MKLGSVEAVVRVLNDAGVRFLVAGGLAVNAHGYLRFSKDADLVLDLEPGNIRRAFEALRPLGYRPSVPITPDGFADAELRARWIREGNMRVLQFWSDNHRETPLDVFVEEPFAFDEEYGRALVKELADTGPVRFVSLRTLIRMKGSAGRPKDQIEIEYLNIRLEDHERRPADADQPVDWTLTTWEGSRREQLRRWAALPLDRTIAALEEMAELADALGRARPPTKRSERASADASEVGAADEGRDKEGSSKGRGSSGGEEA